MPVVFSHLLTTIVTTFCFYGVEILSSRGVDLWDDGVTAGLSSFDFGKD